MHLIKEGLRSAETTISHWGPTYAAKEHTVVIKVINTKAKGEKEMKKEML